MSETSLRLTTTLEAQGPATAIELTDDQVAALGAGGSTPVVVTIDGRKARLRLTRMGGRNLIGLSKASRAELAVEIGQEVEAEVALDTAPREVEVPDVLATALDEAGLRAAFDALAPSRRKEHVRQVVEAKAEATRTRRIEKVLDALR